MSTPSKALHGLTFTPCKNEHEEEWLKGQGVVPVIARIHNCVAANCGDNIGCTHLVMFTKGDLRERLKQGQISVALRDSYEAWMEIAGLLDDLKRIRVKGDMKGDNGNTYMIRDTDGVFRSQDTLKLNDITEGLKEDGRFTQNVVDILISLISSALMLIEHREGEVRQTQEALFDEKFIQAKLFFNEAMGKIMSEIKKKRDK